MSVRKEEFGGKNPRKSSMFQLDEKTKSWRFCFVSVCSLFFLSSFLFVLAAFFTLPMLGGFCLLACSS